MPGVRVQSVCAVRWGGMVWGMVWGMILGVGFGYWLLGLGMGLARAAVLDRHGFKMSPGLIGSIAPGPIATSLREGVWQYLYMYDLTLGLTGEV